MASAPRHPSRDLADRLVPIQDELDSLLAEARARAPLSHHDYDRLEERATAIGAGLRAAFRGAR